MLERLKPGFFSRFTVVLHDPEDYSRTEISTVCFPPFSKKEVKDFQVGWKEVESDVLKIELSEGPFEGEFKILEKGESGADTLPFGKEINLLFVDPKTKEEKGFTLPPLEKEEDKENLKKVIPTLEKKLGMVFLGFGF